ncbi:hypothetical protein [Sedimenticola hydrogenitrophicus]|uniref:hypothetical protein n=1 Tax=Sedimenticola hydrogenitrophicus TaxID=2967975 RepID=UPI0021A8D0B8|nr:hypothetical protein [Sedimenticola hydrogenitrophicus]
MESGDSDVIKFREIVFTELHPDPEQAHSAARLLDGIDGVIEAHPETRLLLKVRYHVLKISLEHIETALIDCGFHLSSKLIYKISRALYYYTEEIQRANNGCSDEDHNSTRKIFINRYEHRNHGCSDPRPEHWRKYL